MDHLSRATGTEHCTTMPYNPLANGLAERGVQQAKHILNKLQLDALTEWDIQLPLVMFSCNAAMHRGIGMFPTMAMFRWNIKSPSVLQHAVHDLMDKLSLEMLPKFRNLIIHLEVIRSLSEYQTCMVLDFNKKHLAADLQCSDCVVLIERMARKCKVVPMGPFHIQTVVRNGGYTLEWDDSTDVPKPPTGKYKTHHLIPVDKATRLPNDMYEVDFIHDHRLRVSKAPLYLVWWRGYTAQHDTWEPAANFDDSSLVAAYQATKAPAVQAQLQNVTQQATRQATKCHATSKTGGDVVGHSHG
ncbi:hypothetical protein H4R24_005632 [Coemansia sp. RSA 988]|nr:hypothetical protein H4R24_005632 [Coemansia sp. RSA 988]